MMYEMEATRRVLVRKGLLSNEEVLEDIRLQQGATGGNPKGTNGRAEGGGVMGTMEDGHLTSIKGMMKKILAILVILAVPAVAFTAPPFVDTEPAFRVITVACEKQPEQELHAPGITKLSPDGDIVIAPQAEIKCRITASKNYYDGTEYITTNTVICTDGENWVRGEW